MCVLVYVREGGWRSSATVRPTVVRPEADPALNWNARTMTVRNDTKNNLECSLRFVNYFEYN